MAKYSFEFDVFDKLGKRPGRGKIREAQEEIKDFIKEQVLSQIGDGKSPVAGGPWKKSLSKEYKKRKGEFSSVNFANLELSGDLLDNLDVVSKGGGKFSIQVKGSSDLVGKAEGNNIGSYGRDPNASKARRFIPLKGETFKRSIWSGVKEILEDLDGEE